MPSDFSLSIKLAVEALMGADPLERAALSGGVYDADARSLTINWYERPVMFRYENAALLWADTGAPFDEQPADIPIMHYLVNAKGTMPTGEYLPYRSLWGANVQSGPFISRYQQELADRFGHSPEDILNNAKRLEATIERNGLDAVIDVKAFPHLPLRVMLYGADDELPAEAKILYDSVIADYLPTEDSISVAEMLSRRLTA
ncbi:hypothetical protein C4J81_17590 [Deltaproteobacteria bacterium Smac51]|nr:hypothetical protein C4J81_17590 [Deltaproteobacteria bacterium Smac51]